jgi:hypothetical protein
MKRPRLRNKREGEVSVPAHEAWQDNGATAQCMMDALPEQLQAFVPVKLKDPARPLSKVSQGRDPN